MKLRNFSSVFILALGVLILVLCTPKAVEPQDQSQDEIVDVTEVQENLVDVVTEQNKRDLADHIIGIRDTLKTEFLSGEDQNFEEMGRKLYEAGAILEDWEELEKHKKYKRSRTKNEFKALFKKLKKENATLSFDVRLVFIDSISEERTVPDEQGAQVRANLIARVVVKFTITSPNPGEITFGGSFEALHREDCPWQNP